MFISRIVGVIIYIKKTFLKSDRFGYLFYANTILARLACRWTSR